MPTLGPQRTPIRGRICERAIEYQRRCLSAVAAATHSRKYARDTALRPARAISVRLQSYRLVAGSLAEHRW